MKPDVRKTLNTSYLTRIHIVIDVVIMSYILTQTTVDKKMTKNFLATLRALKLSRSKRTILDSSNEDKRAAK